LLIAPVMLSSHGNTVGCRDRLENDLRLCRVGALTLFSSVGQLVYSCCILDHILTTAVY